MYKCPLKELVIYEYTDDSYRYYDYDSEIWDDEWLQEVMQMEEIAHRITCQVIQRRWRWEVECDSAITTYRFEGCSLLSSYGYLPVRD